MSDSGKTLSDTPSGRDHDANAAREAIIREATMRANQVVTADVRVILATLRDLRADVKALMRITEHLMMPSVTYVADPNPLAEMRRREDLQKLIKEWQRNTAIVLLDTVDPPPPPPQYAGAVLDPDDVEASVTIAEQQRTIADSINGAMFVEPMEPMEPAKMTGLTLAEAVAKANGGLVRRASATSCVYSTATGYPMLQIADAVATDWEIVP